MTQTREEIGGGGELLHAKITLEDSDGFWKTLHHSLHGGNKSMAASRQTHYQIVSYKLTDGLLEEIGYIVVVACKIYVNLQFLQAKHHILAGIENGHKMQIISLVHSGTAPIAILSPQNQKPI